MHQQHFPIPDCSDSLLFGHDPTPRLVAFEKCGPGEFELFFRQPPTPGQRQGTIQTTRERYEPFVCLTHPQLLEGTDQSYRIETLSGRGALRHIAFTPTWHALTQIARHLRQTTAATLDAPDAPYYFVNDEPTQFLLQSGHTLFKELPFERLLRMQVDLEIWCTPGFDFPNASRAEDRIIAISVSDTSGWEDCLMGEDLEEAELIARFVALVQERNPDVIEGHNILRFDLPYLEARAARHGVPLNLGRDGSAPRHSQARFVLADRPFQYRKYQIYGRHVIDTMLLARLYTAPYPRLSSLGLKDMARQLGLAPGDRTYLAGADIGRLYLLEPERVRNYALDDVRETRAIAAQLLYRYFLECQMVPLGLHALLVRPPSQRLDMLVLREYLRQRQALPVPTRGGPFRQPQGRLRQAGVHRNVLLLDTGLLRIQALERTPLCPAPDVLKVFPALFGRFSRTLAHLSPPLPLDASHPIHSPDEVLHEVFRDLAYALGELLGAEGVRFGEPRLARQLSAHVHALEARLHVRLEQLGMRPLLQEVDHLYVSIPSEKSLQEAQLLLNRSLQGGQEPLKARIIQPYAAALLHAARDIAVQDRSGRIITRGALFRSTNLEPYLQTFAEILTRALLTGDLSGLGERFIALSVAIQQGSVPFAQLCRREVLSESMEEYLRRRASSSAPARVAYELARKSERELQEGDHIVYFLTGTRSQVDLLTDARLASEQDQPGGTPNRAYYAAQLEHLYARFEKYVISEGGPTLGELRVAAQERLQVSTKPPEE